MTYRPRFTIGVSLKMYFGHAEALRWFDRVAELAAGHPALLSGAAELFVIPSFPALPAAVERLTPAGVLVGAQDLFWEDRGAFTGEVSGAELAELGCTLAEIGHAERRRLFGETDETVARKIAAALRNGLTPVLCVGEADRTDPERAAADCIAEFDSAISAVEPGAAGRILVAYEPHWAIGAAEPASPAHIAGVTERLAAHVAAVPGYEGSRVIYGGSAKPGLLPKLGSAVGGLFLGRFAHDPAALAAILDETVQLAEVPA
ncbi:triose-phosphate isomerase family protein [Lysobacter korlensis]|uniref:Triosephosphate isomerase n=1 Tax=Lysobacter korlensis TaxID=553636 RepID=A0ABV6RZ96_9GAMM